MAVETKPEVEIWQQLKKINVLAMVSCSLFQTVLARMYRFDTIQNVTDRQTTQCTKGVTDSMVDQKLLEDSIWLLLIRKAMNIYSHYVQNMCKVGLIGQHVLGYIPKAT